MHTEGVLVPPIRRNVAGIALVAASILALAVPAVWVPSIRMFFVSTVEPVLTILAGAEKGHPSPDDPAELKRLVRKLRQENHAVRQKLIESEDAALRYAAELTSFKEYRAVADKVVEPARDVVIPARVVGRSTNWQSLTIVINRGTDDGVRTGCGVASGQSIVGIVTEVGPRAARVALLSERGVKVPARLLKTRQQGLVVGDGSRAMLKYVYASKASPGEMPRPGDEIVTTGLAGLFRSGWVIGTVADVGPEPMKAGEPFLTIEVAPAAGLSQLESVLVIRLPEAKLEEESP